jgi:colanic acid biosynthesis glycosyl transferase WcaI
MRVVVVSSALFGSAGTANTAIGELARGLASLGLRVELVIDSADALPRPAAGVTVHRIARPRRVGLLGLGERLCLAIQTLGLLRRIVAPGDVCIFAQATDRLPVAVGLASLLAVNPSIHWFIDCLPESAAAFAAAKQTRISLWQRFLLGQARAIVTSSRRLKDYFAECRFAGTQTVCIAQPLDLRIRPIDPGDAVLRLEWGLGESFVVGHCGDIGEDGDFLTILDAAARLLHRPEIVFVFIGSGARRDWLIAETARLGLTNVRIGPALMPERPDVCLAIADVHVLALQRDLGALALPTQLFRIAASGRPSLFVGDEACELAHLVAQSRCGAVVANGDGERLQWWVEDLKRWTAVRADMGAKARAMFEAKRQSSAWLAAWRHQILQLGTDPDGNERTTDPVREPVPQHAAPRVTPLLAQQAWPNPSRRQ